MIHLVYVSLRIMHMHYYTGLQKNSLRINFQYSVSFSPTEHEYESQFFPSRLDFPKNYDNGLKINKKAVVS